MGIGAAITETDVERPVTTARGRPPTSVVLSDAERKDLTHRACSNLLPHRTVMRAKVVLAAVSGESTEGIARKLGVATDFASTWRNRFALGGVQGF